MSNKYDNMLFEILRDEKTLPKFLDVIFGFLSRKTDFYHVPTEKNSPIGLPKGFAEKIVFDSLQKFKRPILSEEQSKKLESIDVPVVVNEEVVVTEAADDTKKDVASQKKDGVESLDCYNGAKYENYSWSQGFSDLDVQVLIPTNLTSKDLQVDILSNSLRVANKKLETLLSGEFQKKIKAVESVWSLENHVLQIHLEKSYNCWWERLFMHEPQLNLSEMDCSCPATDLPQDSLDKIEQLCWEQEQKNRNANAMSADQEKMLRQAWDAEGSPFKEQKFDPSQVTFM